MKVVLTNDAGYRRVVADGLTRTAAETIAAKERTRLEGCGYRVAVARTGVIEMRSNSHGTIVITREG